MAGDTILDPDSFPLTEKCDSYPTSKKQLYSSLPVPLGSHCIRLLDIDPSLPSSDEPSPLHILGHLRVVDLRQSPSFASLSYVWGVKSGLSHAVTLPSQECSIEITENCYQALWHIRKLFGGVSIWVDSICINQDDEQEKESQISLMQEIYSLARSVYVWLGQGNDESDKAMEYLRRRATLGRRLPLTFLASSDPESKRREYRRFRQAAWSDVIARITWSRTKLEGIRLDKLLDREWIHRTWTFQEFALATNLVTICGDKAISWDELASALSSTSRGSGHRIPDLLPVSDVILDHWRCIIDMWFNLPRPRQIQGSWKDCGSPDQTSFRKSLLTLWEEGDLPRGLRLLYAIINAILQVIIWAVWGFISYHIMLSATKSISQSYPSKDKDYVGGRALLWFYVVMGWLIATWIVGAIAHGLHQRWHFLTHGWKQGWLLNDRMKSEEYRVLDAVRAALRERKSSDPRDKSYALYGILKAHGACPSVPDYSFSVGKVYQNLVQDLLSWKPVALAVIMDASSRGRSGFDGPTWVPNWQTSVPSAWLTSRHQLGGAETCTPLHREPSFGISGAQLHLQGICQGTVTYQINMHSTACDGSGGCMRGVLYSLLLLMAHVQEHVLTKKPNDVPLSSLFAILDGISPRRGPTGKWIEGSPGAWPHTAPTRDRWEEFPIVQGPYDFRSRKPAFDSWTSLHDMLKTYVPSMGSPGFTVPQSVPEDTLNKLKANYAAYNYLIRLHNRIPKDKRCLFVLSSGLMGSGPLEMEQGDEVYLLAGVPVPMALRRNSGSGATSVVGAALVHGLMHGESFVEKETNDVVLI
ncbi:HET-domain-containing protein [Lophium mytilinum]|uniref:HET-domain-containing protein n=1 Tax=Lophium mytilinum TaxID=390894 RepID=A0A6A6R810_9PEZI|nr:HET-domain-containing protein [Lophium mytilinum]